MFMKQLGQFFVIAALAALSTSFAVSATATYKWTDEQGNTVYSQQPPAQGEYERLDIRTGTATQGGGSQQGAASSAAESILEDAKQAEKQADVEAQQARAEEIRRQNCEVAKKNLQVYTVYRRIRDEEGNVKVLGDEERQQKIEEAKQQIEEFCD